MRRAIWIGASLVAAMGGLTAVLSIAYVHAMRSPVPTPTPDRLIAEGGPSELESRLPDLPPPPGLEDPEDRLMPPVPVDEMDAFTLGIPPESHAYASIAPDSGLRVAIVCETRFRERIPEWAEVARHRVLLAADILWDQVQVDLVPVGEPVAWDPSVPCETLEDVLEALGPDVPDILAKTGARLAICLASVREPDPDGFCGLSRPFTTHCVALDAGPLVTTDEVMAVTIAHEVSHCFGAFHVADRSSIMAPRVTGPLPRKVDEANRTVWELTRGVNLEDPDATLAESRLIRLGRLAERNLAPGERTPAADQLAARAYRALRARRFTEGERLCRLALDFDPDLHGTRANLAYALHAQGRDPAARAELARALQSQPDLWEYESVQNTARALGVEPDGHLTWIPTGGGGGVAVQAPPAGLMLLGPEGEPT